MSFQLIAACIISGIFLSVAFWAITATICDEREKCGKCYGYATRVRVHGKFAGYNCKRCNWTKHIRV